MLNYSTLPVHMQECMKLYLEEGIEPGGFLYAVLCNDLMGACGNADMINLHLLPIYARFLYNEAPIGSFGSPEKVANYIAKVKAIKEAS